MRALWSLMGGIGRGGVGIRASYLASTTSTERWTEARKLIRYIVSIYRPIYNAVPVSIAHTRPSP